MMMLVLLALFFFFKSRRRAGATEEERREEGESDESKKCFSTLSETPLSLSLSIPPLRCPRSPLVHFIDLSCFLSSIKYRSGKPNLLQSIFVIF